MPMRAAASSTSRNRIWYGCLGPGELSWQVQTSKVNKLNEEDNLYIPCLVVPVARSARLPESSGASSLGASG